MDILNLPPDITPLTFKIEHTNINTTRQIQNGNINIQEINEIKFTDGYQYDAVCPHDNLHFSSEKDWKNHHIEKHMDTKWKCPLCDTISASWHNYSYHVQIQEHNISPPWICILKTPSIPNTNKKAHSTINNKKEHRNKLNLCEKRFGSKYQLLRHMKSEHTNYKVIDCKPQRPRQLSPKMKDINIHISETNINTINTQKRSIPPLPILPNILASITPPNKKRKINSNSKGIQYKTEGKQYGFLNTLFRAATFIENNNSNANDGNNSHNNSLNNS
eukprot:39096_1